MEMEEKPDALCFAGMLVTAFVPLTYAMKSAEEWAGEWDYDLAPVWLLLGYGLLCASYVSCVFGRAALPGDAHAFFALAAYVAAAKHVLRCACPPGDAARRAADAALLCAAGGAMVAAAARAARPVSNCSAVCAASALAAALFAARLARRWSGEPAFDASDKKARKRALATLLAVAAAIAAQPFCGACTPAKGDGAPAAALDALVFSIATDALW